MTLDLTAEDRKTIERYLARLVEDRKYNYFRGEAHSGRVNGWTMLALAGAFGVLAAFVLTAEDMCKSEKFGANNYYGRLAENLGRDPADAQALKCLTDDYRTDGMRLWYALNAWLRDTDGRYGLPTAQAFDIRRYIGLPISQALVRAGEKWVPVKTSDAFGTAKDAWNTVRFAPVETTGLRLEIRLPAKYSAGIQEWKVK